MQQYCLKHPSTAARLHGVTYSRRQQFLDAPKPQSGPSLVIGVAHVWCPATTHSDLPNTYGWYLMSSYFTQWSTAHLWLMFGVQLLYPAIRTLMAHVWCPGTIHSVVPMTSGPCFVSSYYTQWYTENLWLMFGVQLLYTVIYRTLLAHVWCQATIHSDIPKTHGSCLVSLYYTQWSTKHL